MGAEGAVEIIFRKQVEAAEDPAAKKQELIDSFRKIIDVYIAAGNDMIDDVIDPRETRATICRALEMAGASTSSARGSAPGWYRFEARGAAGRGSRRGGTARRARGRRVRFEPPHRHQRHSHGHGRRPRHEELQARGMAIHFRFPESFRIVPLAPSKRIAGNTGRASHAAVGIGPFDLLIVTRFPNRPMPVSAQNINELKPQFDTAVSSALGRKLTSTVGTVGGLPALSYPPAPVVGLSTQATSRITNVFFGDDQYELNCQYTPKAAATITAACNEMLRTLSAGR